MARENKLKGMRRAVTETSSVAAMENYISQRYNKEFESGAKFFALKAIERANRKK